MKRRPEAVKNPLKGRLKWRRKSLVALKEIIEAAILGGESKVYQGLSIILE
ncbi:MAG: hypothetical protein MUP04_08275 [Anaerolineae bacterium]|nr:hypothetical protein [Anaerolineae bacterium]